MPNKDNPKMLSENRKAKFDYEIIENFEAGIELTGQEVKSAKNGRLDLSSGYAHIKDGQVWLLNSKIPAYQPKNAPSDYDPERTRRLLLRKDEIKNLAGRLHEKSLTLVPLRAYMKNNFIKINLCLAKSRKKHDKREFIKKREIQKGIREI
jgi:SsrA-binding protein